MALTEIIIPAPRDPLPEGGGGGVPRPPRGGGSRGGGRGGGERSSPPPPTPSPAAPTLPALPVAPPAPAAPPPPPAKPPTPLQELLERPRSPLTPLLEKPLRLPPLGEVVIEAKKRLRPTGRGGGLGIGGVLSLAARFAAPLVFLAFPSPIGDQPDDPRDFGDKQPGDRPDDTGNLPTPPVEAAPVLETVTVEAPKSRPRERPEPFTAPRLESVPVDFFRSPSPFKPKRQPFPRTRPKGPQFEIVKPPKPIAEALTTKVKPRARTQPTPSPMPSPLPLPMPQPSPRPSPRPTARPLPLPGFSLGPAATTGKTVCTCRTVDPSKKKKRKKKPEKPEPAEIEVEYTQGKQKVKVEGKVERLCVLRRVPIPKLTRRGIRKTRLVKVCF